MEIPAPDWVISLGAQIPLVVAFMWFVLELLKRQDAARERRDAEWQAFLEKISKSNNEAIARIAEEVKANTAAVTAVNAILLAHDIIRSQYKAPLEKVP